MVNKTITYFKQYFFMLALMAMFVGFSAFKVGEGKRQINYYRLVGDEYRMVDFDSGECQQTTSNTCLWEIESEELTIPQDEAPNPVAFSQGEFDGNFATE